MYVDLIFSNSGIVPCDQQAVLSLIAQYEDVNALLREVNNTVLIKLFVTEYYLSWHCVIEVLSIIYFLNDQSSHGVLEDKSWILRLT